jgi:hypothetical protein
MQNIAIGRAPVGSILRVNTYAQRREEKAGRRLDRKEDTQLSISFLFFQIFFSCRM